MPYPNEHSARLQNPDMPHIRVRRTNGSGDGKVQGVKIPSTIAVIWYIIETEDDGEAPVAQALRFPTKNWTEAEARDWLKDNDIDYQEFEPASGDQESKQEQRTIPVAALRFMHETKVQLIAADDDSGKPRFQMVANSGGIIQDHWCWGNFAIDMDGLQIVNKRKPALRDHETDKIVGWTDDILADPKAGILVQGTFSEKTKDGIEAKELALEGFPWQASVYVPPTSIETVTAGEEAEVNGRILKGPGTIFRKAVLREVSFCALGADENTSAVALKAGADEVNVDLEVVNFSDSIEKENDTMEFDKLTVDVLKEQREDIFNDIAQAATDTANEEAAKATEQAAKDAEAKFTAERERVLAIMDKAQEFGGAHDVARACVDGGDSVDDAEARLKEWRKAQLKDKAPDSPGPNDDPNDDVQMSNLTGEEKYKAEFAKNADLAAEFGTVERYVAFRTAEDAGQLRILKK